MFLRGGRLIVLLDPNARIDMTSPANQFGQQPQLASDLPELLKKWGVDYDKTKVAGDHLHASQVNTGSGVMSCLLYTSPSPRDLSTSRMPSSA